MPNVHLYTPVRTPRTAPKQLDNKTYTPPLWWSAVSAYTPCTRCEWFSPGSGPRTPVRLPLVPVRTYTPPPFKKGGVYVRSCTGRDEFSFPAHQCGAQP